jgi:two-component system response regulator WspF
MRIAIVNDMPMAVEALRRVVATTREHQIAWIAYDGAEAVRKCAEDVPDIILMDLLMPVMDGVEATREIMKNSPCAVLVVTGSVNRNASKVFDAMGHGALDAVKTPVLGPSGKAEGAAALLDKISIVGRIIRKPAETERVQPQKSSITGAFTAEIPLIAIGASTGGPLIVAKILSSLPADLQAGIVLIQHVDLEFAQGLADWLDEQTKLTVRLAKEGDVIETGKVLVAGTNDHLILSGSRTLTYTPEPQNYSYRPSANVFFKSVVEHWTGNAIGVLLTGMGRDGAEGLLAMRGAGWHTIAQDQKTSVVYGMPRAAAELNAAVQILPADQIATEITDGLVRNHKKYKH